MRSNLSHLRPSHAPHHPDNPFQGRWLRLALLCALLIGLSSACDGLPKQEVAPVRDAARVDQSIIGGKQDRRLPAVGALTVRNGSSFCTATLVARRVVFTAGHCIDAAKRYSAVQFRIELPSTTDPKGYVYHRYDADMSLLSSHSGWTGQVNPGFDVGVVILKTKVDPNHARPMAWNKDPLDNTWVGKLPLFLGYGYLQSDPTPISTEVKHGVNLPITRVQSDRITVQTPGKSICHGDSGGPALFQFNGQWRVFAINSYVTGRSLGNRSACDASGVGMRTDTYKTYFEGLLKTYGDQGACTTNADCGVCQLCSAQKICVANSVQKIANACKPCRSDTDCTSGFCKPVGGVSRCIQICQGNSCCPSGDQCTSIGGQQMCVPGNGLCPDAPCTQDTDCGTGEKCNGSRCSKTCTNNTDCASGQLCVNGVCLTPKAGSLGDSCDNGLPCEAGLRCYAVSGKNICSQTCTTGSIGSGSPGSACRSDQTCDFDTDCIPFVGGNGNVCLKKCTSDNDCLSDMPCKTISTANKYCYCRSDSECKRGEVCNITALGSYGSCTPNSNPCGTNFECKDIGKRLSICIKKPSSNPCGNGTCEAARGENCSTCALDCKCPAGQLCQNGQCQSSSPCGNGTCEPSQNENCATCAQDCACPSGQLCNAGKCESASRCGNGTCSAQDKEDCQSCPQDCACPSGQLCKNSQCVAGNQCGNGTCESPQGENCVTCPQDCACPLTHQCQGGVCMPTSSCGNKQCEANLGENCGTCEVDCKCVGGKVCQQSQCVDPNAGCKSDMDCTGVLICVNGQCIPPLGGEPKSPDTGPDAGPTPDRVTPPPDRVTPPPDRVTPPLPDKVTSPDQASPDTGQSKGVGTVEGLCRPDGSCDPGLRCYTQPNSVKRCYSVSGPGQDCDANQRFLQCDATGANCRLICLNVRGSGCHIGAPSGHGPQTPSLLWLLLLGLFPWWQHRRSSRP